MNPSFLHRRKRSSVKIVPFGLTFLVSYIFLSMVFATSAQGQTPAVGQIAPDFTLQTTNGPGCQSFHPDQQRHDSAHLSSRLSGLSMPVLPETSSRLHHPCRGLCGEKGECVVGLSRTTGGSRSARPGISGEASGAPLECGSSDGSRLQSHQSIQPALGCAQRDSVSNYVHS